MYINQTHRDRAILKNSNSKSKQKDEGLLQSVYEHSVETVGAVDTVELTKHREHPRKDQRRKKKNIKKEVVRRKSIDFSA